LQAGGVSVIVEDWQADNDDKVTFNPSTLCTWTSELFGGYKGKKQICGLGFINYVKRGVTQVVDDNKANKSVRLGWKNGWMGVR